MASLLNEHQQYTDQATSELLVNGNIYIGTVGLDPQVLANQITIYSDRALTTAIPNPQTTDSAGRTTNKIWIPDGKYSVAVTNSADVQKYLELENGFDGNPANNEAEILLRYRSVDNMAGLLAAPTTSSVIMQGFHTAGDGGGGQFYYDSTLARTNHNGVTIISPSRTIGIWDATAQTAWFLSATDAVLGCWVRIKTTASYNLDWFGAIGDYNASTLIGTDNSQAWRAFKLAVFTDRVDNISAGSGFIPPKQYLITDDNFIGDIDFSLLPGANGARVNCSFWGLGSNSQIYWKPTGTGEKWMYQGIHGQNNLIFGTFNDLYFRLDASLASTGAILNGFQETGTAGLATQAFKFRGVTFVGGDYVSTSSEIAKYGVVLETKGTVNADLTNMVGCRIRGMKTLHKIGANAESVCHTYTSTDAEVMYGDIFDIGGGQNINVFGGSFTMFSAAIIGHNSWAISAISAANPCQVTINGHGFITGDAVGIADVTGTVELNARNYIVTFVDVNNITLDGIDSTGFTAYVSGGTVTKCSFLVAQRSGAVALAGTHNFNAMRCEFNDQDPALPSSLPVSNLLFIQGEGGGGDAHNSTFTRLNFNNCNFSPMSGATRESIMVDAATKVVANFTGCDMSSLHKVLVFNSKTALQTASDGPFTTVNFTNGSAVAPDNVTYLDTTSVARISSHGCPNTLDYDLDANGVGDASAGRNRTLKTAVAWGVSWPDVGGGGINITTLPLGSIIKSIRFRKTANGGAATAGYQLRATDGNAVVDYCSSTIAAQNLAHEAVGNDLNILCDSAATRAVYIIAVAGQQGSAQAVAMTSGDYVIIDYY